MVAVEVTPPKGFGRCRNQIIPKASGTTLHGFMTDTIAPGATIITDGRSGYLGVDALGYHHDRRSQRAARARGEDIDGLLPGVHPIASLAKRRLLSSHQGALDVDHLPGHLDEFCFRLNRRRSGSRGLAFLRVLQLAAGVTHPAWTGPAPDARRGTKQRRIPSAQMDSPVTTTESRLADARARVKTLTDVLAGAHGAQRDLFGAEPGEPRTQLRRNATRLPTGYGEMLAPALREQAGRVGVAEGTLAGLALAEHPLVVAAWGERAGVAEHSVKTQAAGPEVAAAGARC